MHIENKKEFVKLIAKKAGFTQSDVEIIINAMIDVFVEVVISGGTAFVRGLGKLYTQKLPPRKGKNGQMLPEADRVIFRLSETIRNAKKRDTK